MTDKVQTYIMRQSCLKAAVEHIKAHHTARGVTAEAVIDLADEFFNYCINGRKVKINIK